MRWRSIPVRVPARPFLTLRQVQVAIGIDAKVIREWVRLGVFPPPEEIGGVQRWENKSVGLWLEMRRYMPILDCSTARPRAGELPVEPVGKPPSAGKKG